MFLEVKLVPRNGKRGRKLRKAGYFKCDDCGNVFERFPKQRTIEADLHFCDNRCASNSQKQGGKIRKKIEQTSMERHGVGNPGASEISKKKFKETSLKNHGVTHPMKCDKVKAKLEQTNITRYGVKSMFQLYNASVGMKTKYGVENCSQLEWVKQKKEQTSLKNYGVTHHMKLPGEAKKRYQKSIITRKNNNTHARSKIEDKFFQHLCNLFGKNNVRRWIVINGWTVDFYVRSIDAYIQFDGEYWHGLDRSLDVIREFKDERDKTIFWAYQRDRKQDEWFKKEKLRLVRITDKEFQSINFNLRNAVQ